MYAEASGMWIQEPVDDPYHRYPPLYSPTKPKVLQFSIHPVFSIEKPVALGLVALGSVAVIHTSV